MVNSSDEAHLLLRTMPTPCDHCLPYARAASVLSKSVATALPEMTVSSLPLADPACATGASLKPKSSTRVRAQDVPLRCHPSQGAFGRSRTDVLLRAVAVRHDGFEPVAVRGGHIDDDPWAHRPDSHGRQPDGNPSRDASVTLLWVENAVFRSLDSEASPEGASAARLRISAKLRNSPSGYFSR